MIYLDNSMRFEDIGFVGAVFSNISTVGQSWSSKPRYYGYVKKPRPDNGIVLITTDMTARFVTDDGRVVEAHNGDVVFAPQGARYSVDFSEVGTEPIHSYTSNFEMKDSLGNDLCDTEGLRIIAHDRAGEFGSLAIELSAACNDIRNNQLIIMSRFYAFLDAIITGSSEKAEEYYPIRHGIDVLSIEWNKNERISRYAEICGISESYFHMLFKKWAGMSPVDYRNRLRIAHARSILQNSTMSIGEVSAAVGFDDQFYFSRVFKSVTGMSPQKFRKMR